MRTKLSVDLSARTAISRAMTTEEEAAFPAPPTRRARALRVTLPAGVFFTRVGAALGLGASEAQMADALYILNEATIAGAGQALADGLRRVNKLMLVTTAVPYVIPSLDALTPSAAPGSALEFMLGLYNFSVTQVEDVFLGDVVVGPVSRTTPNAWPVDPVPTLLSRVIALESGLAAAQADIATLEGQVASLLAL